ncbi:MAG: hypothetical protein FJ045_02560 [Crenarchaeota archaeon]|nr:hypothetical protein [Thermoproteota archaeon]
MSYQSEISKKTLEQFVKLGGYEIVRYDRASKRWKGVSEAARATKLHRDTVTRLLKEQPTKPVKKIEPLYYKQFEESAGFKRLKVELEHKPWFKDVKRVVLTAFHFLGNKEPFQWTLEDIQKVRRDCLKLRDPATNDIHPNNATELRRAIRALNMYELMPALEMVPKLPAGKKLEWFLEEPDLIKLIHAILRPDTLLYLYTGVTSGARHSGTVTLTPERIRTARGEMLIYETKRKAYVPKVMPQCVIDLLNEYIIDFQFKGDQKIFPYGYEFYNRSLKVAGKNAGLTDETTTHILKHTFVSQASFHGVSLDIISKQTGTEETTLKKYYRAEDVRRARHELRGEEYGVISFPEWIEKTLHPHFVARYKEIKDHYARTDGLRLKPIAEPKAKAPRERRKRVFSWKAVQAIVESKPTTEKGKRLREYWTAIWEAHLKAPEKTYAELKETLLRA